MTCHDVRPWFSILLSGRTGLTERALVEAHLSQCADCRREEAHLRQVVAARHVTPRRALLDSLGRAIAVTRIGVTRSATLVVRLHALSTPVALKLVSRACARLVQAARLGVDHSADPIARLRAVLALALTRIARACARGVQAAILLGIGQSLDLIARLRAVLVATLALTARAIAGMIQATGRGLIRCLVRIARRRLPLATRYRSSVRAAAHGSAASRPAITHFATRVIRLRSWPAISLKTVLQALAAGLVLRSRHTRYSGRLDLSSPLAPRQPLVPGWNLHR